MRRRHSGVPARGSGDGGDGAAADHHHRTAQRQREFQSADTPSWFSWPLRHVLWCTDKTHAQEKQTAGVRARFLVSAEYSVG